MVMIFMFCELGKAYCCYDRVKKNLNMVHVLNVEHSAKCFFGFHLRLGCLGA